MFVSVGKYRYENSAERIHTQRYKPLLRFRIAILDSNSAGVFESNCCVCEIDTML